jgi:two-component system, NtrC family, sensor kinase
MNPESRMDLIWNGQPQGQPSPDPADREETLARDAERALTERPQISIRLRIILSMVVCFILTAGVAAASLTLIFRVGESQRFLEEVSTYAFELEHARRFEKNYLLYGTNLDDALAQAETGHRVLWRSRAAISARMGARNFERVEENLGKYTQLLGRLKASTVGDPSKGAAERADVERELRRSGAQILADANELIEQEQLRLRTAIHASSLVAGGSLLFILFVFLGIGYLLTRQVANPMRRFVEYTQRIARGDFSPIQPVRRYRDEFSDLAIAINRMLAKLKDREAQLARTSRMAAVGTLTAGVAHELNNPLNNIGLNTEAMLDGFDDYADEEKLKMLADIATQVKRASGTVRNLLDFTRVENPVLVSVSIPEVVAASRKLVDNEASLSNVEFDVTLPEELPKVQGNPRDLQQVFLNLFLNAIQAMPKGGTLFVRGNLKDGGRIQVEVTDTGCGIPPEHLGSIFDPFFTTREHGTGLGLYVSYGIIEKHRGRIDVRSQVGLGTTFTLSLPRASSEGRGGPARLEAREEE